MNKLLINGLALSLVAILAAFTRYEPLIIYFTSLSSQATKQFEKTFNYVDHMQSKLEVGEIIIFGSSDLTNRDMTFTPINFFNNKLGLPLSAYGQGGHQCFSILSKLAATYNKKALKNAKIVVLISPGWFYGKHQNGTRLPIFLKSVDEGMLYSLYEDSEVGLEYKQNISSYLTKNSYNLVDSPEIYKYAINYKDDLKTIKTPLYPYHHVFSKVQKKYRYYTYNSRSKERISYVIPKIDYKKLFNTAKQLEANNVTNNDIGVRNYYYTKYLYPKIKSGNFPFHIKKPRTLDKNQEFQDFLSLVKLLNNYNIKPLFVMNDLNPHAFKGRENLDEVRFEIKNTLKKYNFGYLDMWSYNKQNYEMGTLRDIMHLGELGWMKINKKIISHFFAEDGSNNG